MRHKYRKHIPDITKAEAARLGYVVRLVSYLQIDEVTL